LGNRRKGCRSACYELIKMVYCEFNVTRPVQSEPQPSNDFKSFHDAEQKFYTQGSDGQHAQTPCASPKKPASSGLRSDVPLRSHLMPEGNHVKFQNTTSTRVRNTYAHRCHSSGRCTIRHESYVVRVLFLSTRLMKRQRVPFNTE